MTIRNGLAAAHDEHRRVVGAGLLALDVLLDEHAVGTHAGLGGSTGNVLAILAFLGWSSIPVARLGHDVAGERIRLEFERLRVDTRFIQHASETRTPVVYQWPGDAASTHRFSFSCPYCGQKRGFSADQDQGQCDRVLREVQRSDVFYFDRVTTGSLSLAEAYRARGALVVFEPSAVGVDAALFQRAIHAAHVLKFADDRIADMSRFTLERVDVVIQTMGRAGLRFALQDGGAGMKWQRLAAIEVPQVVDTAGAGDWCTAGFLHALHTFGLGEGDRAAAIAAALRYGQALAALNCMHAGARGLVQRVFREHVDELASALLSCGPQPRRSAGPWRAGTRPPAWDAPSAGPDAPAARLCCEFLAV